MLIAYRHGLRPVELATLPLGRQGSGGSDQTRAVPKGFHAGNAAAGASSAYVLAAKARSTRSDQSPEPIGHDSGCRYAIGEGPAYWHSMIVGVIKVPVERVVPFCTKLILFPVPPFITEPFLRKAWQVEKNTSP
jgi:hypothetical protein